MGCKLAIASQSHKFRLSSDWGLKPDPMKPELVVIAGQHTAVNTFSGLVHTARQGSKVGSGRITLLGERLSSAMRLKS